MEQGWYKLLFAHWPVPVRYLRPLVPMQLELETYDGDAWFSLAPFQLYMRPLGLSIVGSLWKFPELNCRTYVKYGEMSGVYFFSLDAASLLAVIGARMFFHLPYFQSAMNIRHENGSISYASERLNRRASFRARYTADTDIYFAEKGTLEYWLAERYCLYTVVQERVYRAEIHHRPWALQSATAEIAENSIGASIGLKIQAPPALLQYSDAQEVLIWPLREATPHISDRREMS